MLKVLKKFFGTKYDKDVKTIMPYVDQINALYEEYQDISNDALRNKTLEFKQRIQEHLQAIDDEIAKTEAASNAETDLSLKEDYYREIDDLKKDRDEELEVVLMEILPEAFAVVKATAKRFTENITIEVSATDHDKEIAAKHDYVTIEGNKAVWKNSWMAAGGEITWNMVHYDVQLIGGFVLHSGKIAEMQTGEGKTLVATLPAYLNGITGQGVHVITVNDYLARRDSEWIGPIFEFLFLTVDCIDKYKPHSPERVAAYKCDITYGTNNEFGFDYLRDNMVRSEAEKVQGKHHFAMIDEVDSVLIDDARTPLIISGPVPAGTEEQEYQVLKPKVERLMSAQKKMATEYLATAKRLFKEGNTGFNEGDAGLALLRAYRSLPKYRPLIKFLSEDGVKAVLQKAENYYMQEQNKNMHLVDEPLLFTIDEKNRNVELTEYGSEYLSKGENDIKFFVMPDIASEMQALEEQAKETGEDLSEAKANLIQDFSIKSRRLHAVSQLLKAYTLFEKEEEYVVIDGQVKIVDEQTGRMMEGRRYSDGLHQALEAKENVKVGDITQTYATITLQNYFRMFHKLSGMTGTAETEAGEFWEIYKLDVVVIPTNRPIVRDDREDLVYKTDREKFNAVIEEIYNLTGQGRPVLVGTTTVDISEKLSRMLNLRGIKHNVLNAKQHQREAEIVTLAGKPSAVTIATNMAGRGTDIKLSDEVKKAGGLAIVATERHDSRRVDRQLRGRAGRQGDPGSSQFYVSLEDKLMRLFNSDRIVKVMDKMGHEEGEVIQHSMITKSIERAQKKVEENNFGIRKRLLEYDDVMNIQRSAIYNKRNNALSGDRLSVDLYNMIMSLTESLIEDHKRVGDYNTFKNDCLRVLSMEPSIDEVTFIEGQEGELIEMFQNQVLAQYKEKTEKIAEVLLPVISNVYENEGHRYRRISVPYVSPSRETPLPIAAELKEAVETKGESIMKDIEKAVTLVLIDENWKEHLRSMDELKDSVQSASFEQKDPLVIYKMEAYTAFEQLVYRINYDVISYLMGGKLLLGRPEDVREAKSNRTDFRKVRTNKDAAARKRAAASAGRGERAKPETFKRTEKKVKRNDPCPCGSGKKYKQCHGA
ncbi:MAG: preprotein translocase subunit SecA [Saprospiraceae bacterium]|nr:preprotein translocase subunit SecA [Saprospiraceae bacterium]